MTDMETDSPPGKGERNPAKKTLLALAVVIAALTFWYHRSHDPKPAGSRQMSATARSVPVAVASARKTDFPVWLTGLGTVTPVYTVTLKTLVNGLLMQVFYKEGQVVKAGDVLAQIDPRPFQVQLEQAQGQLARDEALLADARLDLKRYQTLVKTGAIPSQQLDTQLALVSQDEGNVLTDKGLVDSAKLQLTYARITAPFNGRLGLRLVDPGNFVQTSDTTGLAVLTQLSPITVIFPLPQDDLPQIQKGMSSGQPLPVEAWDRANTTLLATGHLYTLDNQVDVTTGMVKLRAEFDNKDMTLFPNQFVNAHLRVATLPGAVVIPMAGLQQGGDGPYLFVMNPQHRVSVRKVKPGPTNGNEIAILDGLSPGDQVVVDGVDNLRDGMTVEVARSSHGQPPP